MKNNIYSNLIQSHVPDEKQRDRMWERIEASYHDYSASRKGSRMSSENIIKIQNTNLCRKNINKWMTTAAVGMVILLVAVLFLQMGNASRLMVPNGEVKGPESASQPPSNAQNVVLPKTEEQETVAREVIIEKVAPAENYYTAFEGDPIYLPNPLENEKDIPKQLPVLGLRDMSQLRPEEIMTKLSTSLKPIEKQLGIQLAWDKMEEVKNESLDPGIKAIAVPNSDGSQVFMASYVPHLGINIHFFLSDPELFQTKWPLGIFYNPTSKTEETKRLPDTSEENLAAMRKINASPDKSALEQFVQESLDDAENVCREWEDILPWSGKEIPQGKQSRGGGYEELFIFVLTETAPETTGKSDFLRTGFEPTDAYGEQIFNGAYRRISWMTASHIHKENKTVFTPQFDEIPLPDMLADKYVEKFADVRDLSSSSYSPVIGFTIPAYYEATRFAGELEIRDLESAKNLIPKFMKSPLKEDYKILATGMSYQLARSEGAYAQYLIPCYDFILEGKDRSFSENILSKDSDLIRVEISVPAIVSEQILYFEAVKEEGITVENEKGEAVATMVLDSTKPQPAGTEEFMSEDFTAETQEDSSVETLSSKASETPLTIIQSEQVTDVNGNIGATEVRAGDMNLKEVEDRLYLGGVCKDNGEVVVSLSNGSDQELTIGREFRVEVYEDGQWQDVPVVYSVTADAVIVKAGEDFEMTNAISIDLESARNYPLRVKKEVYVQGSDGVMNTILLYCDIVMDF